MKQRLTILLLFFTGILSARQPEKVTLERCLQSAVEHYPNAGQLALNKDISDLNMKNIKTNYYPTLDLNGQASYQSDVTKIPEMPIPALTVEAIPNDWYKINLDVTQMIYDAGVTSGQKNVERAKLAVNNQKVQIELYQLKERINNLFFNIIYQNKNIKILQTLKETLQARIKEANVALNNGMLLSADVDALKVELYSADQKIIEIEENINALIKALNEQTGLNIQSADDMVIPEVSIDNYDFENNRPEYILLSRQQEQVMSLKKLASSKRLPVLLAFGQAGYGRPGYDMLNTNFDDYYMVGIRLKWKIWDWGKIKREKQVFDLQNNLLTTQKKTFDQNLRSDLYKRIGEIKKYEKIIGTDQTIVELQKNVVKTSESKLKNGTITSTTYLIEVNKLVKANLNLEAHKLQLVFAKYQYLNAIGKL
ncbi:MAG: TolC family protein [Chlorobi bacterium]|nr:TolC family protein [Chlorobiota bacterium]